MQIDTLVCGPLSVNTYIVCAGDKKQAIVIDPGDCTAILAHLQQYDLTCNAIFITHGHFDHICGAGELKNATGAKIYIHAADADALSDNRKNLSVYMGSAVMPSAADVLLSDGDVLNIDAVCIRVMHTPGHSPGGASFILPDERTIFCGDTLFREGYGRTDFPGCEAKTLKKSIKELLSLEGDYKLLPGHGLTTELSHERIYNPMQIAEAYQ